MWKFWNYHAPVFAPANEGEGGGAGAQGGEGSGGGEGGAGGEGSGDGAGDGQGEGQGGEGDGSSSILDFAKRGGKEGGEGEGDGNSYTLPDGVELPEHLVGGDANETLAKVAKAYSGARKELSQKSTGGLEGAVPDNADGYTFESSGDDDKIAAELNSEASKPYVDAFKASAHKHGIPDKAFAAFMRDGMQGLADAGVPMGQTNEEAQQISGKAEMEALREEVGAAEAGTIVNTIANYADKLADKGVLADEADVVEFAQMVGTARGARIFHRMLVGEMGEKPIPAGDGSDGSVTSDEAYAAHAKASALPPGAERDQAMAEAQKKMQKAFGQNSAGSIRSSVL